MGLTLIGFTRTVSAFITHLVTMFDKDLEAVVQATGLPERYLRHCLQELKAILKPHVRHGTSNKLLFNDAAIAIFQLIQQQRAAGMNMGSIRSFLEQQSQGETELANPDRPKINPWQAPDKPTPISVADPASNMANDIISLLKDQLVESQIRCDSLSDKLDKERQKLFDKQEEWYKEMTGKTEVIQQLQQGMLMLTAGQNPKEYKQHQAQCQAKRAELADQLKALEGKWFRSKRRIALLKELETYL